MEIQASGYSQFCRNIYSHKMEEHTKKISFSKTYLRGEILFGFGSTVAKFLAFFNTFFILSSLTVYQYGVFQLLLSIQATVVILVSLAGGSGFAANDIIRFIGDGKESKAKKLFFESYAIRIVLGVLAWALFFFGSDFLGFRYQADFILFLKLLSFLFLTETFYAVLKLLLTVRLNFKATASRDSLYKLVQLAVLAYFFFFASIGVREVLLSLVLGSFISASVLLYPAVRAYASWRNIRADREEILFRFFFEHGKWDIIRQFLSKMTSQAQPWLIKVFLGTEAVGIYSAAVSMADVFERFLTTNTLSTLIPRQLSDVQSSRFIFVYMSKYLTLFSVFLSVSASLIAPLAIYWLFPQYLASIPIFYILVWQLPVQALWRMTDIFLVALREQKFLFFRSLIRNAVHLSLLLASLPLFGLMGVAGAYLIGVCIICLLSYRYLVKRNPTFKIRPREFFSFTDNDRTLITRVKTELLIILRNRFGFFFQ